LLFQKFREAKVDSTYGNDEDAHDDVSVESVCVFPVLIYAVCGPEVHVITGSHCPPCCLKNRLCQTFPTTQGSDPPSNVMSDSAEVMNGKHVKNEDVIAKFKMICIAFLHP